ncbi:MAG TPA: EAL domain-containing protein, partial [Burkholderiaceae bacterium]
MRKPVSSHPRTGWRQRLRFLRGSWGLILLAPLICLFLGTLLWAATQSRLADERRALEAQGRDSAAQLARAYALQLARAIAQIDHITLQLKYDHEHGGQPAQLQDKLRAGLYPATGLLYVNLAAADGSLLESTYPFQPGMTYAGTDFYAYHRDHPGTALRIGTPAAGLRDSSRTVIRFTRRLDNAQGRFDGVVAVVVDQRYFAPFSDLSGIGPHGFLAAYDDDGTPMAALHSDSSDMRTSPLRNAQVRPAGLLPAAAFTDGRARFLAYQPLSGYPLHTVAGVAEQAVFAAYRAKAADYRANAIAVSVLLAVVALAGMGLSARLAWRAAQARQVERAYRLATEGGTDGFFRTRALYDDSGELVDYVYEDCNERGAAMGNMRREELLGTRASALFEPAAFGRVLDAYKMVMVDGRRDDEFQSPPGTPLAGIWLRRKMVRLGHNVAITITDISAGKLHEQKLLEQANRDPLTHLPNRLWLTSYLPDAIEAARRDGAVLAILFVDLDDLKSINDTLGHPAGDEVIRATAHRLRALLPDSAAVARLGGDEFTIVLPAIEHSRDAGRTCEAILAAFGAPVAIGAGIAVRGSIGVSLFPQDAQDADTLLRYADIAMYAAKSAGKARTRFFEPHMAERLLHRFNSERELRLAVERDEFVLYYQPRVDTVTGQLRSMEALVRWNHPVRGVVGPGEFIGLAESTGLIAQLGAMVMEKACAQQAQWLAQQVPVVPLSVNVSPRQFEQHDVAARLAGAMARHGVPAALIEVELTESCMMGEEGAVADDLAAIKALGVKLLVDDFGTGYSSLSQLQR